VWKDATPSFRLGNFIAKRMHTIKTFVSRVLVPLLRDNVCVERIDISENTFDHDDLTGTFRALAINVTVKHLVLRGNVYAIPSVLLASLMEIIRENRSLISLDLRGSTMEPDVPAVFIEAMASNTDVGTSMYDILTTYVTMPRLLEGR